jgi:type II secretory pathway predicted ATPase ExeA
MGTLTQVQEHKLRLEANPEGRDEVRGRLLDYMERAGLAEGDFARRIGYSRETLRKFISDQYHVVAGSSKNICRAINECIAAHPLAPSTQPFGEIYETANTRVMRQTFQCLLPRPSAYMLYGPPGSQKSFVLEHLVAEVNHQEMAKAKPTSAAFYVYAMAQMTPSQLMKAVAIACGTSSAGDRMRIARNLSHEFQSRRVLLVIDEAQQLSMPCFETLRSVLDRPPNFSLLFAGSHDLKQLFDRFSATLEQWNSRIIEKVKLPGVEEDEAEGIIRREIGEMLKGHTAEGARKTIRSLIRCATVKDGFEKNRPYLNIRTLSNALLQLKLQSDSRSVERTA